MPSASKHRPEKLKIQTKSTHFLATFWGWVFLWAPGPQKVNKIDEQKHRKFITIEENGSSPSALLQEHFLQDWRRMQGRAAGLQGTPGGLQGSYREAPKTCSNSRTSVPLLAFLCPAPGTLFQRLQGPARESRRTAGSLQRDCQGGTAGKLLGACRVIARGLPGGLLSLSLPPRAIMQGHLSEN